MDELLALLRRVGAAFVDAYVVVDAEGRVLDFNRHYFALFPRAQARKLKGSTCCQYLRLGVCDDAGGCLARRCTREGAALRFDEIPGRVEPDGETRRFIVSAAPIGATGPGEAEGGPADAALILLRDVSDAADVQRKYKEMLDREAREKDRLREQIVRKTKELMDANVELNRVQKELMGYKKGLFG